MSYESPKRNIEHIKKRKRIDSSDPYDEEKEVNKEDMHKEKKDIEAEQSDGNESENELAEFDEDKLCEYAQLLRDYDIVEEDLDTTTLFDLSKTCFRLFCGDYTFEEHQKRNAILFGSHTEMRDRFHKYAQVLIKLDKYLCGLTDEQINPEDRKEISTILDKTSANIFHGKEAMIYTYQQVFVNNEELARSVIPARMADFFKKVAEDDMKGNQKLIRYYLQICRRRKYRKLFGETTLFEPLFTSNGDYTHHFRPVCEMETFVFDAVYPYRNNPILFQWLTDRPGNAHQAVNYLRYCLDDDLPVLKKQRYYFSFRNCFYDADKNIAYPYIEDPDWKYCAKDLDANVVSCHFLDHIFDYKLYSKYGDPLTLPTPHCDKILVSQKFDDDVKRWMYASWGRLLFDVGSKDNWQYFPFCKGTAGSGKSTFLKLGSEFYNPIDVGSLMSESSKNFSIEHLHDKYVFFCYDTDDKMTLSQTRWNSMVSGELMAIARKFKIPIQKLWIATGAFAGNAYPPWIDQAGNVSRRFLMFIFGEVVTDVDPNLFDKCRSEMAVFMKKCVSCYLSVVDKFGEKGLWDNGVLPKYFHRTRALLQAETNPLVAFLHCDDECKLGAGMYITYNEFNERYIQYCKKLSITIKRLSNDDFIAPVLSQNKIALHIPVAGQKMPNPDFSSKYFEGVTLI